MKRCNRCGIAKQLRDYRRVASSADGYNWRCRACEAKAVADAATRAAEPDAPHVLSDGPFALAVMSHKEVGQAMVPPITGSRVAQIERVALNKLYAQLWRLL